MPQTFPNTRIFVVDIQGKCQRHIQIHSITWRNGQQTHIRTRVIVLGSRMLYSHWSIGRKKNDQAKNDDDSTSRGLQLPGFLVPVKMAETAHGNLH